MIKKKLMQLLLYVLLEHFVEEYRLLYWNFLQICRY